MGKEAATVSIVEEEKGFWSGISWIVEESGAVEDTGRTLYLILKGQNMSGDKGWCRHQSVTIGLWASRKDTLSQSPGTE